MYVYIYMYIYIHILYTVCVYRTTYTCTSVEQICRLDMTGLD